MATHLPDYLRRIANARTPEAAADAILAHAATMATGLYCYPDSQRLAIVTQATQQAETLCRPWPEDLCKGDNRKPWRLWLRQWGYLPQRRPAASTAPRQ
jgi:hypothetical protein